MEQEPGAVPVKVSERPDGTRCTVFSDYSVVLSAADGIPFAWRDPSPPYLVSGSSEASQRESHINLLAKWLEDPST